jgi:hypothetical protein
LRNKNKKRDFMKKIIKAICCILIMVIALGNLAACNKKENNCQGNTSSNEATDTGTETNIASTNTETDTSTNTSSNSGIQHVPPSLSYATEVLFTDTAKPYDKVNIEIGFGESMSEYDGGDVEYSYYHIILEEKSAEHEIECSNTTEILDYALENLEINEYKNGYLLLESKETDALFYAQHQNVTCPDCKKTIIAQDDEYYIPPEIFINDSGTIIVFIYEVIKSEVHEEWINCSGHSFTYRVEDGMVYLSKE